MSSADSSNRLDFVVKRLSKKSDLSDFDCSRNDELGLNEFIHKEASKYQQEGMVLLPSSIGMLKRAILYL